MYKHTTEKFGKFIKHTLSSANGNRLVLVPAFGACPLDIQFNDKSILDAYDSPIELDLNRWAKNNMLFPFANRLKDGNYVWNGKSYHFPINDHQTGNALHGFGADLPMEVKVVITEERHASITCVHHYDGHLTSYPFPFSMGITYSISDRRGIEITMAAENEGNQSIPFVFGWHPYFQLSESVDSLKLKLPECEMVGVDMRMLPTGKRYFYEDFAALRPIGVTVLDNCFALSNKEGRAEITLTSNYKTLHYWQETGKNKFNYVQLFTPPYRTSIAIEPMTGNIDAFNNGEGLIILEPGERVISSFGFMVR